MKKIELNKEELDNILKMYNDELLGSHTISEKTGISKPTILRILKDNNVIMGSPGRRNIGGKQVADKRWREKNKDSVREYVKTWNEKNKEHRKQYLKEYREKNINNIRKTKRDYERNRKASDPLYKLISNFRTAIYQVLKESNVEKNGHYFDILGYTPEELINHLEKQFTEGMTWENYGEFHIDHKLPISSFNIKEIGDEEFMKCWSLDNLQPMWGEENIRKSNKILEDN
jgi:predicted DNA-binding transcriptional regulator AlpA